MYTLEWPHGTPSLAEAATALRVRVSTLDQRFGVVPVNPTKHIFAVLSVVDHVDQATTTGNDQIHYANPKIEAF